jgi:hypothetical protein
MWNQQAYKSDQVVEVNPTVSTATMRLKQTQISSRKNKISCQEAQKTKKQKKTTEQKQLNRKDTQDYLWMKDISSLLMYCQVDMFPNVQNLCYWQIITALP